MTEQPDHVLKKVRVNRVFIPIGIGFLVVGYLLYREFDPALFSTLQFTWTSLWWILASFAMMAFRDLGYIIRLRVLTHNRFSWRQSFRTIMMWEFSSALTPSAVGGSGIAIYIMHKEGLTVGKATSIAMATILLDDIYFGLIGLLVFFTVNGVRLFSVGDSMTAEEALSFTNEFFAFAVTGYLIVLAFTLFLCYALFINPKAIQRLLLRIFSLRILRKWKKGAEKTGADLVVSSNELKQQPFSFWLKAFGATLFSWTGRYFVVNTLLLAFFSEGVHKMFYSVGDHFLIFARQLAMWVMMLDSPTPGGSGCSLH